MTIADVLTVFLVILSLMLVFQAFWLFGTALFPRMVGQARDRYKTPIRTTLIGLVVVPTATGFAVTRTMFALSRCAWLRLQHHPEAKL